MDPRNTLQSRSACVHITRCTRRPNLARSIWIRGLSRCWCCHCCEQVFTPGRQRACASSGPRLQRLSMRTPRSKVWTEGPESGLERDIQVAFTSTYTTRPQHARIFIYVCPKILISSTELGGLAQWKLSATAKIIPSEACSSFDSDWVHTFKGYFPVGC